jgi:hypothetical protein
LNNKGPGGWFLFVAGQSRRKISVLPHRGGTLGRLCGYVAVQMDPRLPRKQDQDLNSEIDPAMCFAFVLFVFLIVPFTLLSPFNYPQTSTLDKFLSVNAQYAPRSVETKFSDYRAIDRSVAALDPQATTGTVTR